MFEEAQKALTGGRTWLSAQLETSKPLPLKMKYYDDVGKGPLVRKIVTHARRKFFPLPSSGQ